MEQLLYLLIPSEVYQKKKIYNIHEHDAVHFFQVHKICDKKKEKTDEKSET